MNRKSSIPEIQEQPLTSLGRQMDEDNQWALTNYQDLVGRYPAEYIVVWRKQVIAHNTDAEEALRAAAAAGGPRDELGLVAFPGPFAEIPY
jgi:hypothetical protein